MSVVSSIFLHYYPKYLRSQGKFLKGVPPQRLYLKKFIDINYQFTKTLQK